MRKSFTRFLSVLMVLLISLGAYASLGFSTIPIDGTTNVDKTKELSVTFPSDVTKGTGFVRFYEDAATDIPLFVEQVTDARIVVSGKKVVFQFNSLMADGKDYYVTWDEGAFKLGTTDVPAVAMGDWNWTTGDYTAPVLDVQADGSHLNYKSGSTNVVTTAPVLTMLFNENVVPTTGDERVFIMKDNGTAYGDVMQVLTKAALATDGGNAKQIDITLTSNLDQNSTYYVIVEPGAVRDGSTNKFAGFNNKTTWTFSTKDTSAPEMTITKAEVTKTKVSYNVAFSEKGKLYYMVVASTDPAPTSLMVQTLAGYAGTIVASGTESYTGASSKVIEKTLANTTDGGTHYSFYFVSETNINVAGVTETLLSPPVQKDVVMVDAVAPTYTVSPADNATGVLKDQKLILTFNEDVKLGTGNVTVKKTVDNSVFETYNIADAKVSDDKKTVTIDLATTFASTTEYYVLVPAGVITDLAGNSLAAISDVLAWSFTSEDYAAPTFTFNPANGSSSTLASDLTTNGIQITFSEQIEHRDGSAIVNNADISAHGLNQALVLKEGGVEVPFTYTVTGTPNVISVFKTGGFVADKDYSLTFLSWYVADVHGNIIPSSPVLNFHSKDNVAPSVSNLKPDNGSITKSSDITINFSEPIRIATGPTTLTDANVNGVIVSFLQGAVPVDFTATVSADKKQIIINPVSDLTSGAAYTIVLSSDLEDLSGNDITGSLSWPFTANDYVKPLVTLVPADGAAVAAAGFAGSVSFNEAVTKVIGGGNPDESVVTLREGSATGVIIPVVGGTYASNVLPFTAPTIAAGKTYYLTVGASVKDGANNVNESVTSVFTTKSSGTPVIAVVDSKKVVAPLESAVGVAPTAAITVTFSDPIAAIVNAPSITITGATVTGTSLSADAKTLTITHTAIPTDQVTTVNLAVGAVTSQEGTAQAGPLSWSFTTKDTTAPTAPVLTPADDATGILIASTGASATKLVLTFPDTDDLHLGTGDIKIRKTVGDAIVQQLGSDFIKFSSEGGANTKETVTVSLNADLDYATGYYVQVSPNLILDAQNNAFAGISAKTDWNFVTQAAPAFVVDLTKCNPKAYQDSVLETSDLLVTFNNNLGTTKDNSKRITLDEITFVAGTAPAAQVLKNNVFSLPPNDPAFTWAGKTLTINYIVDLLPNKAYRLTLDNGAVNDVYGGLLSGSPAYVFFTSGKQGPVATVSPADGDKNVARASNVVITFNEPFYKDASKGTYTPLALQTDHTILKVGSAGTPDMAYTANINGNSITLDLADFQSSEVVTVTVGAGKFYDASGNIYDAAMDGTGDVQTATFTVEDYLPPTAAVSSTSSITGTGFKYKVESNEKGIVYSKVVLTTAAAPTKAEIAAATTTGISTINTASSDIVVTGLTPSTNYKIYLYGKDETGNEQAVISADVTTIDDVAPVLASTLPVNGAVDVAAAADIDLVFDEPLTLTTSGQILVKEKVSGTIVDAYPSGTAFASVNGGKTARFNSAFNYVSGTSYVVEVDKGTIKDASGNPYNTFLTFEFTTKDIIAPTVALTSPDNAGSKFNVQNGNGLVLTFSEAVKVGAGKVGVYEDNTTSGTPGSYDAADILIQLIDPASMVASADNKTRTFNITNPIKQQSTYFIVVPTTSFKDLANNDLAAAYTGKIVITDTTAPKPQHAYSPGAPVAAAPDANISVIANIVVTFDEPIFWNVHPVAGYLYSLNVDSLVTVTGPNGAVKFDATIDATNKIITINPTDNLSSLTTYVVTVSQVQDVLGNLMDTYSFSFKTVESTPAKGIFNPANDAKNVNAVGPFKVTFDKNVYVYADVVGNLPILAPLTTENVNDYFTLVAGDDISVGPAIDFTATVTDGKVVTITPKDALDASGSDVYTYGIVDTKTIYDSLGNPLVGTTSADDAGVTYATVTVQDLTAPTLTSMTPNSGTDVDSEMKMTFNEDIAIGTGNLYIRRVVDGQLLETIAANADNLTVDGKTVVIKHADFPLNTKFYVVIDKGFVTDLSTNKYAGITDDMISGAGSWTFNTVDTNRPMLVSQSPAPAFVDVLVGQNLKLTFNKGVKAGAGYISIYKADGTPFQLIDVTSSSVVFNQYAADTVVTISHMAFMPETEYFVRIDKGAITDLSGNKYDGIANQDWNFITEDITAPKLVSTNPLDDATSVSAVQVFEMTFDRNVAKGSGNIKIYDRTGATLIETLPVSSPSVKITNKMVSFQFVAPLVYNSEYYIIVEAGAITNASVNAIPFGGITTALAWSFTTGGDMEAPMVVTATPDATTVLADNHPTFVITFNEDIMLGAGNLVVTAKDGVTPVLTIPVTAAMVSGKTLTVTYVAPATGGLNKNTEYYVLVDKGAVTDKAGNEFDGITDATKWTFKTGAEFATVIDGPQDNSLEFKVYPNPFVGFVNVDNASKLSKVVVSNIAGQTVKVVVNPTSQIQLNELRSGIYFISLYEGNVIAKTAKIVKR